MKILIASSSPLGIELLKKLKLSKHQILGAISSPDRASGRGQGFSANRFADFCQESAIEVWKPENREELSTILKKSQADLVITLAYGKLIKKEELVIPKHGWLNVHFSILPRWRGASPIQNAIAHGDKVTGISVFQLDEGMDTGPIYSTIEFNLGDRAKSGEILEELATLSFDVVNLALEKIESGIKPEPQSREGITLAPKILKSEGRIAWNLSAEIIDRKIRAMHPWPGAFTSINGFRLNIIDAKPVAASGAPGSIISMEPLIVGTGSGAIEILTVKAENKKEMSSIDWLRGARISMPSSFE